MKVMITDAEYDVDTWEDVKDATLTDAGDILLLNEEDKVDAIYARGHWRKVEIVR